VKHLIFPFLLHKVKKFLVKGEEDFIMEVLFSTGKNDSGDNSFTVK